MKIKVGWVLVVALLVSIFIAPTAYAMRRKNPKNNEAGNSVSVSDDDDDDDDDDDPKDGCRGSSCNMIVFPCHEGCVCVPIGMLPIGVCAGRCCSSPPPPPSPTPPVPPIPPSPTPTPWPPLPPTPPPIPPPTPAHSHNTTDFTSSRPPPQGSHPLNPPPHTTPA